MKIDQRVAHRVSSLRSSSGLTLERLAALSGVSRSTISSIERAETSPTAVVLDKLAAAFGIPLAALFAEEAAGADASPLARAVDQQTWIDPGSGYARRHLSPTGCGSALELAEITFPPGKSVDFNSPSRSLVHHQLIWMLDGEMEITVGDTQWRLQTGDCLALVLDRNITFRNSAAGPARYAVALTQKSMRNP